MARCSVCGKNYGHYCSNCSWDKNFARGYCSDECRRSQGIESYTEDELLEAYRALEARLALVEPVYEAARTYGKARSLFRAKKMNSSEYKLVRGQFFAALDQELCRRVMECPDGDNDSR